MDHSRSMLSPIGESEPLGAHEAEPRRGSSLGSSEETAQSHRGASQDSLSSWSSVSASISESRKNTFPHIVDKPLSQSPLDASGAPQTHHTPQTQRRPVTFAGALSGRRSASSLSQRSNTSTVTSSSTATAPSDTEPFEPVDPEKLLQLMRQSYSNSKAFDSLLVCDIRPHAHYLDSRIKHSVNINIPSALMRRSTYDVNRVAETLSGKDEQAFRSWQSKEYIVATDAASESVQAGHPLFQFLTKLKAAGYTGHLAYLKGGIHALERTQCMWLVSGESDDSDDSTTEDAYDSKGGAPSEKEYDRPSTAPQPTGQTTRDAATAAPTQTQRPKKSNKPHLSLRDSPSFSILSRGFSSMSSLEPRSVPAEQDPSSYFTRIASTASLNKFFGGVAQSNPNSMTHSPKSVSAASTRSSSPSRSHPMGSVHMGTCSQLLQMIRSRGRIGEGDVLSMAVRDAKDLVKNPAVHPRPEEISKLPPFLQDFVHLDPDQYKLRMLDEYMALENYELDRLEHVFTVAEEAEGGADPEAQRYSVSASLEQGGLNRVHFIFPYEHSRVKLHDLAPVDSMHVDDRAPPSHDKASLRLNHLLRSYDSFGSGYINASHISLPETATPFIATQAPLDATRPHFWHMVAQEDISVIVMITRLHENGRFKSARYWDSPRTANDPWVVTVDEAIEDPGILDDDDTRSHGVDADSVVDGSFFTPRTSRRIVKRSLTLSHQDGIIPPRKVVQLQYRAWSDHDAPDNVRDILHLIKLMSAEQAALSRGPGAAPILAHCSAGVGRTGALIAVYSILERISRHIPLPEASPVLDTCRLLRNDRMTMVANLKQYAFIYDCVLAALLDENTSL